MSLTKPYYDIEQFERIMLKPEQMNSDILLNMKINLREKIEGKCNKYGFIDKIYKILEYRDGLMNAENLSGSAIYPVKYHCRIYAPLENTTIIGEIFLINPELIIANNGPIKIFIPRENVNSEVFDLARDFMVKKSKTKLTLNDKVEIIIKDKRINPGDKNIKCIGYLKDIADSKNIKKYYDTEEENIIEDDTTLDFEEKEEKVEEKEEKVEEKEEKVEEKVEKEEKVEEKEEKVEDKKKKSSIKEKKVKSKEKKVKSKKSKASVESESESVESESESNFIM